MADFYTIVFSECKQWFLPLFLTIRAGDQGDRHRSVQDGGPHSPRWGETFLEKVEAEQLGKSWRGKQLHPFLLERRPVARVRRPE